MKVTLAMIGGRGSPLARQNDEPGAQCGIMSTRGLAIATSGQVSVTDENHKIVALTSVPDGHLIAGSVVTQPGGTLVAMRCDVEFTIDLASNPKYLTFDFTWANAVSLVSVSADTSDIHGGELELTKQF